MCNDIYTYIHKHKYKYIYIYISDRLQKNWIGIYIYILLIKRINELQNNSFHPNFNLAYHIFPFPFYSSTSLIKTK